MLRQLSRQLSQSEVPASPRRVLSDEAAKVIRAASIPAVAFEIGVLNLILMTWLFGAHPEHYWVAYVVEFPIIVSLVAALWSKAGRCLYFLEFCWVINLCGWLFLLAELLPFYFPSVQPLLPPAARLGIARAFFATANGPLALSVIALSNAVVFHDPERTGAIMIHFGPALTTWAIRWKEAALQAAWPGAFGAAALPVGVNAAGSAACAAITKGGRAARSACAASELATLEFFDAPIKAYFVWWAIYGVWLLAVGCELPERRGWRSSFGDMRPICSLVCKKVLGTGRDALRCHAALYLMIHALIVSMSLAFLPKLLYVSVEAHSIFLVVLIVSAVRQGAHYYKHAWGEKLAKQVASRLKESRVE